MGYLSPLRQGRSANPKGRLLDRNLAASDLQTSSDAQLLGGRICDLPLQIKGSILEGRIDRVLAELNQRDLRLRPNFWLSDDWFTPEGLTGVAIPFYLAHPRLTRLERRQMGEAEGHSTDWCLRILRHELGHVVNHAFGLHRRAGWHRLFGSPTRRYPTGYRPNPRSRGHVQNLEYWYAQAHPEEDFAETFAVCLQARSRWRTRYQSWPRALEKLTYVDSLLDELAGRKAPVHTRSRVDSLARLTKTLAQHYAEKQDRLGVAYPDYYDAVLCRHFTRHPGGKQSLPASTVLCRTRAQVLRAVAAWDGDQGPQVDYLLRDLAGRCRELGLFARDPKRQLQTESTLQLAQRAMDSLARNHHWVQM